MLVDRAETDEFIISQRCFGDDEDIDVAVARVVAAEGERAAKVETNEVVAKRFADAGQERVNNWGDFGWKVRRPSRVSPPGYSYRLRRGRVRGLLAGGA